MEANASKAALGDPVDAPTMAGSAEDRAANRGAAERNARNALARMITGPVRTAGNPDDSARVVLCWAEGGAGAPDRWDVAASWRGYRFQVAQHRGKWFITREGMHPADLNTDPNRWKKREQLRHPDRRPIVSRAEAEVLMIARVEERRAREAEVRRMIEAAAARPAPRWRPAATITRHRNAPRTTKTPADVLAKWGDSVTYEEISEP